MASMIEKLEFIEEPGGNAEQSLTVYSLSTCAFCKRAMDFLKERDVAFRYVQLDKINPMVKATVKSELKKQYDNLPVFPVLVINDERALSGFNEEKWRNELGL